MPLTLKRRIGVDTVAKLEAAAARRYAEAHLLESSEPLGAIYLYGYTVEIRLKCAYYRLAGIPIHVDLNQPVAPGQLAPRKMAENAVCAALQQPTLAAVGHHLVGWATALVNARSVASVGPYSIPFQDRLLDHVKKANLCWIEVLRYRSNRPYHDELAAVVAAARWIKHVYRRLWS